MIEITEDPDRPRGADQRVRSNQAGAVCTFLGTVREMTGDRQTLALDYEAYPEMALKKLAELEAEAASGGRSSSLPSSTGSAILTWARSAWSSP